MKRFAVLVLASLSLALPFTSWAQTAAPTPPKPSMSDGLELKHDIEIGNVNGVPIHLETAVKTGAAAGPALPAILMIHGGGWRGGKARESMGSGIPNPGLYYAQHGYYVASIEYRLSGVAKWPAQIQDCKLAVRYLRAHAKELNIDPDRIGCCGFSAGGHLAACLGAMQDVAEMEGSAGYPNVSSRVQAVVMISGTVDLAYRFEQNGPKGEADGTELFGDVWKAHPEIVKDASPINYVKPGLPPFWIGTSDHDTIAPAEHQADVMAAALKKAGVPCEYVFVKNAGHGLTAVKDHAAQGFGDPTPTTAESLAMTLAFLDQHLKSATK